MILVEHVLGLVGALIDTPVLAFSSGHSGGHFSCSIFIPLMLLSPFFAGVMKFNLRFEDAFQK